MIVSSKDTVEIAICWEEGVGLVRLQQQWRASHSFSTHNAAVLSHTRFARWQAESPSPVAVVPAGGGSLLVLQLPSVPAGGGPVDDDGTLFRHWLRRVHVAGDVRHQPRATGQVRRRGRQRKDEAHSALTSIFRSLLLLLFCDRHFFMFADFWKRLCFLYEDLGQDVCFFFFFCSLLCLFCPTITEMYFSSLVYLPFEISEMLTIIRN